MFGGLDVGYFKTAASYADREAWLLSVSGPVDRAMLDVEIARGARDGVVLTYRKGGGEERTVAVGERALQSWSQARRGDQRWYTTDLYRDLVAGALSEATAKVHATIDLVAGVPIAAFRSRDDALARDAIEGTWHVRRADRSTHQTLEVKVLRVVPQPFGAAIGQVLTGDGKLADEALARARFGVIDVGGHDAQFLTVEGLRDIGLWTISHPRGGWNVVQMIHSAIQSEVPDLRITDHALAAALADGRGIPYYDGTFDLSPVAEPIIRQYAEEIVGQATSLWDTGADLRRIFLCGGGQHFVEPWVKAAFRHAVTVPDPAWANVRGYAAYAAYLERAPG